MTEKKMLDKYNALRTQNENCGRQVMNLRSEIAGMRDSLDTLLATVADLRLQLKHAETRLGETTRNVVEPVERPACMNGHPLNSWSTTRCPKCETTQDAGDKDG